MGQNNISSAFTVNVVQDGVSQPSYVQTQEAWSNNATSASESTMPSDCVESDWQDGTPAKDKTYLWRRSRTMTLNNTTRQYTAGSWSYQRLSGENGTSISVKEHVDYAYSSVANLPQPSSSTVYRTGIVQSVAKIYQCLQVAANTYDWVDTGKTINDGYSYTIGTGNLSGSFMSTSNLTNHLIMWSAEAGQWIDLGLFQGQSGKTYYTHIAWATETDASGTIPSPASGQTSRPNKSSVTGFSVSPFDGAKWMGVLVNQTVSDSTTANLYTWSESKGENAVDYKISLAGSVFAADPNTDTMIVNIKGKVYKIDGSTTSEYSGWGTADLTLYFQAEGENPDIVPTSKYTKTGAAFATTYYNEAGWDDEVIFGAILSVGGVEVARESIQVEVYGQNGQQGQRGKMSRNIYYAGMWDDASVRNQDFTASDYLAPYVNVGSLDAPVCKVYVGENTSASHPTKFPDTQAGYNNNADWDSMATDFKYLITQAIFSNFAHLGAAIISGDYMISQYGYMLGFGGITQDILDASQYMNIDPNDVLGEDDMYDYTQLIWNDLTEKEIGSTSYQNFATAELVANRYYTFELEEHTLISGNVLDWTIQTSGGVVVANGTITSTASGYKKNDFLFKCNTAGTYILKMKARNSQAEVVVQSIYLRLAKFVPFYAVDMLQGKMVANRIIARGELHADSLYYEKREGNSNSETIEVGNQSIVNLGTEAVGSLIVLPAPSVSKGRKVEIFNSADYFQATWQGATGGDTFAAAYGSGFGFRTSYNLQLNYMLVYCDGTTWWCLRAQSDL